MKRLRILFLVLSCLNNNFIAQNGITYTDSGRFGDCMLTYYRTKWLAWKYNLRFLYKPFVYSDKLAIHDLEVWFEKNKKKYTKTVKVKHEHDLLQQQDNVLYLSTYFTHYKDWLDWNKGLYPRAPLTRAFLEHLKKIVKPRAPMPPLPIPSGAMSVAVHVRKGGGFDKPLLTEQESGVSDPTKHTYIDVVYPLKFPPDDFYIEQIAHIAQEFTDKPLYVYIFTDDKNPERLAIKYNQHLNNSRITFDYRKNGNAHNSYVVEDFFAMQQCECLIRPDSSFSKAAELIADYKIVIYPKRAVWQGNKLVVDTVEYNVCNKQIDK